jgi:hypothetical protein
LCHSGYRTVQFAGRSGLKQAQAPSNFPHVNSSEICAGEEDLPIEAQEYHWNTRNTCAD